MIVVEVEYTQNYYIKQTCELGVHAFTAMFWVTDEVNSGVNGMRSGWRYA